MNQSNLADPSLIKELHMTSMENNNIRNTLNNLRKVSYHVRSHLKEDELYPGGKNDDLLDKINRLTSLNKELNEVNLDLKDGT